MPNIKEQEKELERAMREAYDTGNDLDGACYSKMLDDLRKQNLTKS